MDQRIAVPLIRARRPPPERPSPWQIVISAPHRAMFMLGAAQIVAIMLWWAVDLAGRYGGFYAPIAWQVPPMWAHAFLMNYALFPLFIFGFALTAVPNWTGRYIPRWTWRAGAALIAAGIVFIYAGLALDRTVLAIGVALLFAGWLSGGHALARLVIADRARDKHALGLVVLLTIGALGVASFGAYVVTDEPLYAEVARRGGIWLFLLPLFLVISHRLIPFFSSRAIQHYAMYRPRWSMPLLAAGCAVHFALEMLGLWSWTWLVDAPMAAWVGHLALRWGLTQSFRVKLLTMLHLSVMTLAFALALYAADSFAAALGHAGLFGLGPLHALVIGYFTATAVAMVSRVSLGHSGRALEADTLTWRCFIGVLGTAGLRTLADVAFLPAAARTALVVAAALAWLAVLAPWALRYAAIYVSPRADGKPG